MDKLYLGTSIQQPLVIEGGRPKIVKNEENITQSIKTILGIKFGTRFFLPEYGSRIDELIFEPNDEVLRDLFRLFVQDALRAWEGRAEFYDMTFEVDPKKPNVLFANISYKILQTNEVNSFVYPFYTELIY